MPALKTTARYVFSAVVFALILYLFGANDVLATIKGANIASVIVALGLALGAQVFASIRLRHLLAMQDISLRFRQVFFIGLSAVFYGLVIPGGTVAAFVARFVQLSKAGSIERIGAALVVDRVMATVTLLAIGAGTIAFDQADPLWAGIIVAGIVGSAGAFLFMKPAVAWLESRLDGMECDETAGKWRVLWMRISRALLNYSSVGRADVMRVIAASLTTHLFGCFMFYAIAIGVGLDISFLTICWIRTGMILSTMIPVSVAGLGLRELTAVGLMVPRGFGQAQAVGYAILIFLVRPVMIGILGGAGELFGATTRP